MLYAWCVLIDGQIVTTVPNGVKLVDLINTSTKWQEKVDAMESILRYITDHGSSISSNSEAFVVFALFVTNQMKASNINILKCGMETLLAVAKNCQMGRRSCLLIVPCILTKVHLRASVPSRSMIRNWAPS